MTTRYSVNAEQLRMIKHALCNVEDDAYRNYYNILEGGESRCLLDDLVEQGLMIRICDPIKNNRAPYKHRLYYAATEAGANLVQVEWVPYGYTFYGLLDTRRGLKVMKVPHDIYHNHVYPELKIENGDNPRSRKNAPRRAKPKAL